jgi:RNA polymerase sigma factor (sigma-70 family)
MSAPPTATSPSISPGSVSDCAIADFEVFYRANVASVMAFFARRCREPELVADLTSETFVQVIASLGSFDPARGTARAWLFGIVRRVWAQHCERSARGRAAIVALSAYRQVGEDEIEELAARMDAHDRGRELLARLERLPPLDRAAVELVDLDGLQPREAATVLSVSAGALRVRLFRARSRLRRAKEKP